MTEELALQKVEDKRTTKRELIEIYTELAGEYGLRKSATKGDIVDAIKSLIRAKNRGRAFNRM